MSLLMLVLQVCAAYRDPLIYETELKLKCMKTNIATLARFSMNVPHLHSQLNYLYQSQTGRDFCGC